MSLTFDSARMPNPHPTEEHEAWRTQLRRFVDTEITPYAEAWAPSPAALLSPSSPSYLY